MIENLGQQFLKTGEMPMFASAHEIIHGALLGDMRDYHLPDGGKSYPPKPEDMQKGKEALLAFKLSEASNSEEHSGIIPGAGLAKRIQDSGYDWKSPISIEVNPNNKRNPIRVVNGHHRLAVMYHTAPHEPIPIDVVRAVTHYPETPSNASLIEYTEARRERYNMLGK